MPRPVNIIDGQRKCPVCEILKPLSEFSKLGGNREHLYDSFCKPCRRIYSNTRRQDNRNHRDKENARRRTDQQREKNRIYLRQYHQHLTAEQRQQRLENGKRYAQSERGKQRRAENRRQLRREFIEVYGGKCQCCGETTLEFLTIEHLQGGGRQERKTMSTEHLLRKLKRAGWEKDKRYGLLCFNCNQAKGAYGYCPHQKNK